MSVTFLSLFQRERNRAKMGENFEIGNAATLRARAVNCQYHTAPETEAEIGRRYEARDWLIGAQRPRGKFGSAPVSLEREQRCARRRCLSIFRRFSRRGTKKIATIKERCLFRLENVVSGFENPVSSEREQLCAPGRYQFISAGFPEGERKKSQP